MQQLQQLASSDRPFVKANLADWWIPQLSSKSSTDPGLSTQMTVGRRTHVRILREHRSSARNIPE